MNRRLAARRTVYNDDGGGRKYSEEVRSDFDGLGNYRKVVRTGNFEDDPVLTTTTDYNPGLGYVVDADGNVTTPLDMISSSEPWVLHTFASRTTTLTESGYTNTSKVETTFDPATGFLQCVRTLKNPAGGRLGERDVAQLQLLSGRLKLLGGLVVCHLAHLRDPDHGRRFAVTVDSRSLPLPSPLSRMEFWRATASRAGAASGA